MSKKYTVSIHDEISEMFSLEMQKSQLLNSLLAQYYEKAHPNDFVAKQMQAKGYFDDVQTTEGKPIQKKDIAKVASVWVKAGKPKVVKTKEELGNALRDKAIAVCKHGAGIGLCKYGCKK